MTPFYLVIAYVCLMHAGPLLNLFALIPGARVFPITTLGHLLMVYLTMRYFTQIGRAGLSRLDLLVTAFVVWSLASFVLFFQADNPSDITAYAYGVHLYVMPIFGYFGVKTISSRNQQRVLKFILWSNVFVIVSGLYLWWARPAFYTVFLREVVFTSLEDWSDWMMYLRLQSYLSSTALGLICAITVALVGAAGTGALRTIFVLAASIPAVLLTYQRGGQAGALVALVYLIFWGKASRTTRPLILIGGIALASVAIVVLTSNSDVNLSYYLDRKNDYNSSLMEGRRGYTVGMDYVTAFPLGVGLGGSGNAAAGASLTQWDKVVDANFMRIFADLGVQGIMLFLTILGIGIHSGFRRSKNIGLSFVIIIYSIVAIGTNVFDGHLTPQLFWLILGMADTPATAPEAKTVPVEVPLPAPDLSQLQPATSKPSL